MRKLLAALAVIGGVLIGSPISAQIINPPGTVNITTSGSTCATAGACAVFQPGTAPTINIQITGTFTGTLQFESTSNGAVWTALLVVNTATGVSVTSTTAAGSFGVANSGFLSVRVRASAFASGQAIVDAARGSASFARRADPAPADATFITQTASSSLSNEQALGTLSTGLLWSTTTTGVVASIADVAAGQVLISGSPAAYSATPSITSLTTSAADTFTVANVAAGPATAPNQAININNSTASTSGVVAQWSPGELFTAHGWDTDDAVDRTTHAYFALRPVSGATVTQRLLLRLETSPFSGSYDDSFIFANTGNFTALGTVTGTAFVVTSKSAINSGSDGLFTFSKNSGVAAPAVEVNMGTAAPTTANCSAGSAAVVAAHSTNTAGSIAVGSGSTSCDVVFGAPAFSFAPFCVATDYTSVILAPKISARSTTGFTITGLTAGDTFGWVCFGGT